MAKAVAEKTRGQIASQPTDEVLPSDSKTGSANWYKKVRLMRKDSTISVARELAVAPILAAPWMIEANKRAPEGAKDQIADAILPLRLHLLRASTFGCYDYGWQAFEKVIGIDSISKMSVPLKIKPLLQDITKILIDRQTGAFMGLRQEVDGASVDLTLEESLLVNIDVEGTNWYGQSKSEAVENAYDHWNLCNTAAVRYDKKLAGAHWIIYYPVGFTPYNGVDKDNYEIAKELLNALESSGCMAVPNSVDDAVKNLNNGSGERTWLIELKSAYPTSNVAFLDRLKYLDTLKARAYGLPERAILEGQFGTKAEAEAHGDFAITNMEVRHSLIVQHINWHLVNHLLRLNYGEEFENTVYIKPSPLSDKDRAFLRELYKALLANETVMLTESERIDTNMLRMQIGLPTITAEDRVAEDSKDAAATELSFFKRLAFVGNGE